MGKDDSIKEIVKMGIQGVVAIVGMAIAVISFGKIKLKGKYKDKEIEADFTKNETESSSLDELEGQKEEN